MGVAEEGMRMKRECAKVSRATFAPVIPAISHRTGLILLFLGALAYAFLNLGGEPYHEGDEARGGINALEMRTTGDLVNLRYMGAPDEVRAKPPLLIWCISASMEVFGPTPFALRFPSAVAITLAFLVLFQLITLYRSPGFALLTGLVLLSVTGMAGWHVGRTGDFDAILLLFLLTGLYFVLRYLDLGHRWAMVPAGFFWGLAFLTKGLAMGALFPGMFLYLLLTRRLGKVLSDGRFWVGVGVWLLFVGGWYAVVDRYGATWEEPLYTGENVFERLIVHDIWERFTQPNFEGRTTTSKFTYFLSSLDRTFNLWNYPFFGFLLYGLYRSYSLRGRALDWLRRRPLLLLSLCLWFPYAMLLSLTPQALRQYIVPVLPFVGIATVWGFVHFERKREWVRYLFYGLLVFTLVRHMYEIYTPRGEPPIVKVLPEVRAAERVYVELDALANDELYYVYLANQEALLFDSTRVDESVDLLILRHDSPLRERAGTRDAIFSGRKGKIWQ
jgi:4-amino-4-deoxy-L-arabinose transferase-like glycosyltransferase